MPYLNAGLWQNDVNTKTPSITHILSYKAAMTAANTTSTLPFPNVNQNPAQVVAVSPSNISANVSSEPQQGRRMIVTQLVIRDANGNLSGSGATAGGSVSVVNITQGNAVLATVTSAAAATMPAIQVSPQSPPATAVICNPYDQLGLVYTAPTGATATATLFTADVFGYWQQGV
jgi:hypothetical protein